MNRKFNFKRMGYFVIILLAFLMGLVLGMLLGTYTLIDHVAYGLAGSTFVVNFNETKMIQEFNKTIMPTLLDNLNKSLRK
jgi:hypothetical protein